MPMESHCIYLGTARATVWTKTSQDRLDSTTGKLHTALLCCPAAVSSWKGVPGFMSLKVDLCLFKTNKTKPYLKTGQMWNTSARLSLSHKSRDQKCLPHQPQTLQMREITRAKETIRHSSCTGGVFPQAWGTWLSFVPLNWLPSPGIWTQLSAKGTLDAHEVWEWQLYSYQIRTANYPRGRASFFTKKHFHVHAPLRNPFMIFTESKG